jgi:hypothetical protein
VIALLTEVVTAAVVGLAVGLLSVGKPSIQTSLRRGGRRTADVVPSLCRNRPVKEYNMKNSVQELVTAVFTVLLCVALVATFYEEAIEGIRQYHLVETEQAREADEE